MKMRAAGIPVGSPKPGRTQPTARNCCPSTVLLEWLRSPKKSRASFSNRGRRLPQSIRPTTVPEPDPIYPLLPFLSTGFWQRPCHRYFRAEMEGRFERLRLRFAANRAPGPIVVGLLRPSSGQGLTRASYSFGTFTVLMRTIIARHKPEQRRAFLCFLLTK